MAGPQISAGRELFLVLEDLSSTLAQLLRRLMPMSQAPQMGQLLGVDVLYQREKDVALLALRFDTAHLDGAGRKSLISLATSAGVPVLDPQRLNSGDRSVFYQRYLRRYSVRIDDQRNPNAALDSLGQLLGLIAIRAKSDRGATLADGSAAASKAARRPSTRADSPDSDTETRVEGPVARRRHASEDIPLVLAPIENSSDIEIDIGDIEDIEDIEAIEALQPPVPRHALGSENEDFDVGPHDATRNATRDEEDSFGAMDLGPAGRSEHRPRGKNRRNERLPTIPARPTNTRAASPPPHPIPVAVSPKLGLPLPAPPSQRSGTAGHARGTIPVTPAPGPGAERKQVRARFQRGDSWMPARLRNLTTKEIRLAASAAPPLGGSLRVAVNIGDYGVLLSGIVVEVINTERSVDGSTSFRVEVRNLLQQDREKLIELLRMAQREGISLTPPPARRNRRFAISWPVAVVSEGHRFNAAALDISERGLFLATGAMIRANQVVFGIPLDRAQERVQGRARVAREVSESMARAHGLSRGYGLQIEDLSLEDQHRFGNFLVRVRQRSQRHVLVAGAGERAQHLAECFQSAGYAVSKASTVETMMQRTHFERGGPDIAVVDESTLSLDLRSGFESAFRVHQVPMLKLQGQAPHVARDAIDHAMSV